MMKASLFFLIFTFFYFFSFSQLQHLNYFSFIETNKNYKESCTNLDCRCLSKFWSNHLNFIPNDKFPFFILHLNIIIIQKSNTTGNFPDNFLTHKIFSQAINHLNYKFNNLTELDSTAYDSCFNASLQEPSFIPSTKIQFSYSLHFIANDSLWGMVSPTKAILNNEQIRNSIRKKGINIYFTMSSTTWDSLVLRNTPDPQAVGYNWAGFFPSLTEAEAEPYIVLPNKYAEFIFCINNYDKTPDSSYTINHTIDKFARILSHELGHILGLGHNSKSPHYKANQCPYSIMHQAGNALANTKPWLPPSEIGEIHRLFHISNLKKIIPVETYSSKLKYIVTDTQKWDCYTRIYGDIIIKKNSVLEVSCIIYMAPQGKIILKKGAKIILNGGSITTYANSWQGIFIPKNILFKKKYKEKYIVIKNNGTIEKNLLPLPSY